MCISRSLTLAVSFISLSSSLLCMSFQYNESSLVSRKKTPRFICGTAHASSQTKDTKYSENQTSSFALFDTAQASLINRLKRHLLTSLADEASKTNNFIISLQNSFIDKYEEEFIGKNNGEFSVTTAHLLKNKLYLTSNGESKAVAFPQVSYRNLKQIPPREESNGCPEITEITLKHDCVIVLGTKGFWNIMCKQDVLAELNSKLSPITIPFTRDKLERAYSAQRCIFQNISTSIANSIANKLLSIAQKKSQTQDLAVSIIFTNLSSPS